MASKDSIVYFIDILRQHAEEALDILSDTVCNPMISEGELEEVKSIIQHQNVMSSADALSREAAMMAAYAGSSLGNSHICPLERVELVDRPTLQEFRSKYYFAENCIISGVGIDHEYMVELVRKKFSSLPGRSSGTSSASSAATIASTKRPKATFSGSLVKNERKLQEPFVKVAICFEAGDGWSDPSLVAMCVLQTLLGGGKSFSAGGPGKGIHIGVYIYVHSYIHIHYVLEYTTYINTLTTIHAYTLKHIHTYMHIHIHAYTHTCIYTYMHINIHAYKHRYIHMYMLHSVHFICI